MNALEEGKLLQTVEQLSTVVVELTAAVKRLEAKQHYWTGALAAVGVMCATVGAVSALVVQWFRG